LLPLFLCVFLALAVFLAALLLVFLIAFALAFFIAFALIAFARFLVVASAFAVFATLGAILTFTVSAASCRLLVVVRSGIDACACAQREESYEGC